MFQTFDPYYQWLGIPKNLQPPHHYRLLGLELFESNPDVISVAADRQMAHVRMYQLGAYSDLSQKLLNELAAAKVCLLIPERKAVYDSELRKTLAISSTPAEKQIDGDSRWAMPVDDELGLAPSKPSVASPTPTAAPTAPPVSLVPRESPSSIGNRKTVPTTATPSQAPISSPSRQSPSSIGTRKTTTAMAAVPPPKPPPASHYVDPPAPSAPWSNEPPYMAEYRRRFFETLLKVGIFLFLLVIILMLFNALVLPSVVSVK